MQQRMPHSSIIVGFLSLAVLVGAALTSSLAQAQSVGVGPYYAPPSWNRTLPSAARFMVLTNFASAAVLDRETGLVWEKTPTIISTTWSGARGTCANLVVVGGRKGWRLPSLPELASLVDPNVTPGPTLPPGHPFTTGPTGVQSANYWSATTLALDPPAIVAPTAAWIVNFGTGNVFAGIKSGGVLVWCVRGAMNADAY
jgi:hypothetical protein